MSHYYLPAVLCLVLVLVVETAILRSFGWFGWLESLGRSLAMNGVAAAVLAGLGYLALVWLDHNGDALLNALFNPAAYLGVAIAIPTLWFLIVVVKALVFALFERSWRGFGRGMLVSLAMSLAGALVTFGSCMRT